MSDDRLDLLDYYELLSVDPASTADQLRAAFHKFALKYHPDNHAGREDATLARATQIFRRGAEAYRVLSNSETRRRYDEALSRGQRRLASEPEPSVRRPSGAQTINRKAHPFFKKAELFIRQSDWSNAKLQLKIALQHDPESALVQAKLAHVEDQIAAKKR